MEIINKKIPHNKKSQEQFIEDLKLVHGDRFDYSRVIYNTSHDKIEIICKLHGIFTQKAYVHLQGSTCSKCTQKYKLTNSEFIQKSKEIYGDKFTYENTIYKSTKNRINVNCKAHGEFSVEAYGYLYKNQECPKCQKIKFNLKYRKNLDDFIKEANTIHNFEYDYSKSEYTGCMKKLIVTCKLHGDFTVKPNNHLSLKSKCPKCSGRISKQSDYWLESLNNSNIIPEYKLPEFKKRKVDGYDHTTNTVYQFHGSYYHADPRLFCGDEIDKMRNKTYAQIYKESCKKDNDIVEAGYNLIIMWQYDWNTLNNSSRGMRK